MLDPRRWVTIWLIAALAVFAVACADDDDDNDSDNAGGDDDDDDDSASFEWTTCERIDTDMTLAAKAALFDRRARDWHLAGDGLLRTVNLTEDLSAVDVSFHVPNTILWSGMYLASQAFRYEVTGEAEAVENARIVVRALTHLTRVTGVSGLYGRSMADTSTAYNGRGEGNPNWVDSTAPGYGGWRFNNDVSKDGYAGLMFGYAAAMEHFDDEEIVNTVRARIGEIAAHLLDNGLQIIDVTGEVTEHGRLFVTALDDFPGFNAMLASSWIKIAATATGDRRFDDYYYGCLMRMREGVDCPKIELIEFWNYIESMEKLMGLWVPNCKQSWDNFDMMYQGAYPLLMRETDPELLARLKAVVHEKMYTGEFPENQRINTMEDSGHTFFTFIWAAITDQTADSEFARLAVDDGICTMKEFPDSKHERLIPIGTQEQVCTSRLDDPVAAERVPLAERYFDNYVWRLDPYVIENVERPENLRHVHSPEDYLVAYWMGRYHGYFSEEL